MEHSQSLQLPPANDALITSSACSSSSNISCEVSDTKSVTPYEHDSTSEKISALIETGSHRRQIPILKRSISFFSVLLSYLSIIFPRSLRPASSRRGQELSSTAYLDALRGYAAWIVYNSHVIHEDWRPETSTLMQWPCFKILFRGHAQVDIFFVISGYALSHRMLGHMYSKEPEKVLNSLSSSTFRRYLRLFAPTAAASFITMIALTLRLATKGEGGEVLKESFAENLTFLILDTIQASNPFAHVAGWWYGDAVGTKYLPQMWTIAIEFRGSMILFLFCAATCRVYPRKRMFIAWICIIASSWWQAQYAGLFLAGMWIADLKMWNERKQKESSLPSVFSRFQRPILLPNDALSEKQVLQSNVILTPKSTSSILKQMPYFALATFSLKLLTAPLVINNGHPFPFGFLARLMPPKIDDGAHVHWPLAVGAVLLIYSVDNSPILQKPFRLPVSQFIGELSFGIYAMHNTVRWIVWENLFVKWQLAYWGLKAVGFWNLLPGYLVMSVLVIWAAEWFRRIDVRILMWIRALQEYCFES